jgi:Uncharacterized protein conserved in bacteria (DUF2059)
MNPRLPILALLLVSLVSGCLSSRTMRDPVPSPEPVAVEPDAASTNAVESAAVTPVVLPTNSTSVVKVDPTNRVAAIRYMDAIGIERGMTNLVRDVIASYRANLPRVPDAFWQDFAKGVTTEWLTDRFVQEIATIYTLEELNGICTFFESELGRKFMTNERTLQQRNAQHVAAFTRVLSRELENRLRARKFIF